MTLAALTGSRPWWVAGWTMLHFLWVGAALGLAAAATRRALWKARPEARYDFALASLMVLALAPGVITLLVTVSALPGVPLVEGPAEPVDPLAPLPAAPLDRSPTMSAPGAAPTPDRSVLVMPDGGTMLGRLLAAAAARLPWLWLAGAPATFALLATGLVGAERLRRQSRLLTEGALVDLCRRLADALGLTRPVTLGVCERLVTPLVLGVVRPMILLPPAALTGWSPELVEMALLHELAHVRRLDILINLIQRVVESILFFHPAVWIVSGWVRQEREHCCDRLVVDRTGRPTDYAEALFSLVDLAPPPRATAVAMARNHLVVRIRRILDPEDLSMKLPRTTLALITVPLFLIPALLIGSQVAPLGPQDREQPDPAVARERNAPAQVRIPGRIVAEAWRMGEPASKERVAGVTGVIEISPETGEWRLIDERRGRPRLSPDGLSVAFVTQEGRGRESAIWTASVQGGDLPVRIANSPGIPVWSPDGKQIITSASNAPGQPRFETWRMDADGADRTKLPLAETDQVVDWSADGQLLVRRTKEGKFSISMVGLDGAEPRPMSIRSGSARLSPDGRKIVYTSRSPRGGSELTVSDIDGGNRRQLNVGENVQAHACWSPDGRWLAVSLVDYQMKEDGRLVLYADPVLLNCRIEIVDPDGNERRPLNLPPGYVQLGDWR